MTTERRRSEWGAVVLGIVFALLVIGWVVWLYGLFVVVACSGLQSNPGLSSPNDPCADLGWAVFGGFIFLLVASLVAFNSYSKRRS